MARTEPREIEHDHPVVLGARGGMTRLELPPMPMTALLVRL
jgi:hypothetical protein